MLYRSQIFVPGNRPDRFERACLAGADLVCIDLEDAVTKDEKAKARDNVLEWLSSTKHKHVSLRINGVGTEDGQKDIASLKTSGLKLPFIMIPKVSFKSEMNHLDEDLSNELGTFFPIIESAKGLINSAEIFSHSRVTLGMYGAVDYAGDVDCDLSWETHLFARSKLVAEANAYDVQLFDAPHINVRDLEDCEATTRKAKALGIHARSAIHPAQIERVHAALAPTDAEIARAERVIAAYQAAKGNVVLLDGTMVEAPIIRRAERIVAYRRRDVQSLF